MDARSGERKRRKHTRSKMGCRVCRIRRVRCDQTRPACKQCTSTGRVCEGYPAALDSVPTPSLAPRQLLASQCQDPLEERSWYYFRTKTVYQFSAPFGSEFWSRLVLQVGEREACVRHAIVALGSLHEAFQYEHHDMSASAGQLERSTAAKDYACDNYSKALSTLNAHIRSSSWGGLDVSLLCCILCIGIEWLRGRYRDAHAHMTNGLLILQQWSERQGTRGLTGISYSSPTGHLIRRQIAPILMRIALQAKTFADNVPSIPWTSAIVLSQPACDEVGSLQAARDDLDLILSDIYLCPDNYVVPRPYNLPNLKRNARLSFSFRLAEWYSKYHTHLWTSDAPVSGTRTPSPEQISLTIWHVTLTIMLASSQSADQMLYDALLTGFNRIVSLAETLVLSAPASITSTPHNDTRFRFDMDLIPMLYFVASKCRHPVIRRRAIALMRNSACREGLWDGEAHARLGEEVVRVEEEGLGKVDDEKSIPAEARVQKISEEIDLDNRRMEVRFLTQGEGRFGPWRLLTW